ncbi:MAG: hypothetical protein K8U03_20130 [Planctomycetia bacterium]|nr:hypothetical protein [Planctomycetia bacterium]
MARKVPNQKKLRRPVEAARPSAKPLKAKKPVPAAKVAKVAKPVAKKDGKAKPAVAKEAAKPIAKAAENGKAKVAPVKTKAAAPAKPAKEPKPPKEPAVKKKRKGPGIVRLKAFWGVFNQMLKRVAVFEYADRKPADKKAADLSVSSKQPHFVQLVKEIIREAE